MTTLNTVCQMAFIRDLYIIHSLFHGVYSFQFIFLSLGIGYVYILLFRLDFIAHFS